MTNMEKITPFLWFDTQAEEAAELYVSIFPDSKIEGVTHYSDEAPGPTGRVMTVSFILAGQRFTALNGGPHFRFTEAISFVVGCEDQDELDAYWEKLLADGGEPSQCGWLKDRFGVSWQIVPNALGELLSDPDPEKSARVTHALLQMVKLDIGELKKAYDG
jgi:predicted 3-demethylubiquinone-9 3-methyltransferase (glyoxalase superfamily)